MVTCTTCRTWLLQMPHLPPPVTGKLSSAWLSMARRVRTSGSSSSLQNRMARYSSTSHDGSRREGAKVRGAAFVGGTLFSICYPQNNGNTDDIGSFMASRVVTLGMYRPLNRLDVYVKGRSRLGALAGQDGMAQSGKAELPVVDEGRWLKPVFVAAAADAKARCFELHGLGGTAA